MVGNVTKIWNDHTIKFGADVRRAHNLRVPSDSHRSGELTFNTDRTRGPSGGGLGLATFLLGDVTRLARYVSSSTDARERQWRHFYYAQDTWRPTPKLTLNYGLRLDIINPQTVNEAGQRRLARPRHGPHQRRRRGGRGPGRQHREQPELGAAAGRHVSDRREDGDPRRLRAHLRHRRLRIPLRAQRDAEPAGARVPGGAWRRELRRRLHAGGGSRRPELPDGAEQRAVRAGERHQHARRCPGSSGRRPSTRSTSRCSAS